MKQDILGDLVIFDLNGEILNDSEIAAETLTIAEISKIICNYIIDARKDRAEAENIEELIESIERISTLKNIGKQLKYRALHKMPKYIEFFNSIAGVGKEMDGNLNVSR